MGACKLLGIEALNLWILVIQKVKLSEFTGLLQQWSLFRTEMLRRKPALKKQAQQVFKLEQFDIKKRGIIKM